VVDPLTVAQVGAVYQAAAAAAYKAVAASSLMPNLSKNVSSLTPQPSQAQPGLFTAIMSCNILIDQFHVVTFVV